MGYEGGCLCGSTSYIAKGDPINPHLCSCTMCQKSSGAPTVAWVEFPLDDFQWVGEKPGLYRSSEKTQRCFCKNCGGLLGTLNDGYMNICVTIVTLKDPNLIEPIPGRHSYRENAPKWWLPKIIEPNPGLSDKQLNMPMPIFTPRLILRPPKIDDTKILNEAILESFDELHRHMEWAHKKPSLEETEKFVQDAVENWKLKINDEPYLPIFIFDKDRGTFVGATGYHHYNWSIPSIETGYWVRNSYAKQGFMTEAIHALTQYAFKQLKVNRMTITCNVNNTRSKRIPEKLGYVLEGILKSNRRDPLANELSDTLVYSRYDLAGLSDLPAKWGEINE